MLRSIIQTQEHLEILVAALRDSHTLGACADLIDNHVTDPRIKEDLARVVGKKSNKPLNHRKAHDLAATMLDFESAHVMAAHYKSLSGSTYNVGLLTYNSAGGTETRRFVTQDNVSEIGFLRLIGPLNIPFIPYLEYEELEMLILNSDAGHVPESQIKNSDYLIDPYIGTCVLDAVYVQEEFSRATEEEMPFLLRDLAILRKHLDTQRSWGSQWVAGEPTFGKIDRVGGPTKEKLMSVLLDGNRPGPDSGFVLDPDSGVFVVYSKDDGELEHVVLFSD